MMFLDLFKKNKFDSSLFYSSIIVIFLASFMIFLDYKRILIFSDSINILFPYSIIFYPFIAIIAEIFFHMIPLYLFLKIGKGTKITYPIIVIVSLIEPLFQIIFFSGNNSLLKIMYLSLHIFIFNVVQLIIYKRNGFWSMYALRIIYYLSWHIIWGYLRLQILF